MASIKNRHPLLYAALVFGAIPACAGAAIFLSWLATRNPGLAVAGVAVLIGGAVSVLVGAGLLALHLRRERARGAPAGSIAGDRRLGGFVVLADMAVAALLTGALFVSSESYSVTVRNLGSVQVDSFAIVDAGRSERTELGAFAPGEERSAAVRVKGETALTFEMLRFGQVSTGTVTERTGPDLAADQWCTITIGEDGKAVVEESLNKAP
jgi:hypothetical protein